MSAESHGILKICISTRSCSIPYLLVYLQYVVIPDNGGISNIIRPSVIITALIVIGGIIASIVMLIKKSSEHKGLFLTVCAALMTLGLFLLSTSTNIHIMLIGVLPVVIGNSIIYILLGAAVKDFIPEGKAGLFQGLRMIFTVMLPMVIGPVLGDIACRNAALTYTDDSGTETIVPSKIMFLVAAIVCSLALIPLFFLNKVGFNSDEQKEANEEGVKQ